MTQLLNSKICLVTGAKHGIGKAIALRFAKEGGIVYVNARHECDLMEWLPYSDLSTGELRPLPFDVTDSFAMKQAVMKIKDECGVVDVLVNNAAIISYEFMGMMTHDNLEQMFKVNVFAAYELIQRVSRMMSREKSGSIINISSMVGEKGASGQVAYSMTKGAISSLTKSAAKELAHNHIRVNAVAPGMVRSERFEAVLEKRFPESRKNIRFGRLAEPSEIADACLFLASDESSYITGQIIGIDGSMVL